jgi:hypothetical protein
MQVTNASSDYVDWILSQAAASLQTVGALTTDAEYGYLRHVGGALDSAMIARGTYLADQGQTLIQTNYALTISLLFGAHSLRGTISADNFTAGSMLDLYNQQIASATLNGLPIAFTNQGGYGRLFLPGAGELVVNFASVPEPSTWLLLGTGAGILWLGHRRRCT